MTNYLAVLKYCVQNESRRDSKKVEKEITVLDSSTSEKELDSEIEYDSIIWNENELAHFLFSSQTQ